MNPTRIAHSTNYSHANQLVIEGFEMGVFDKLKVVKARDNDSLIPEEWHVLDANGKVLRKFHNENDAEDYKKYLNNLKVHEIDVILMGLFRNLEKANREIESLKEKLKKKP